MSQHFSIYIEICGLQQINYVSRHKFEASRLKKMSHHKNLCRDISQFGLKFVCRDIKILGCDIKLGPHSLKNVDT